MPPGISVPGLPRPLAISCCQVSAAHAEEPKARLRTASVVQILMFLSSCRPTFPVLLSTAYRTPPARQRVFIGVSAVFVESLHRERQTHVEAERFGRRPTPHSSAAHQVVDQGTARFYRPSTIPCRACPSKRYSGDRLYRKHRPNGPRRSAPFL